MSKNDIYEFKYLDNSIKRNRERALKNYIIENEELDLAFYGLDFFNSVNNKRSKMLNVFRRSFINQEIILNNYQIEILSILENNNLFLSAPTSFGKTFIVLEFLMRHKETINNVVFIVPTLALMNELIKKIHLYFSSSYNICINADEVCLDRNIFIFVPERSGDSFFNLLKNKNIQIDLLVFDEIYKLKAKSNNDITRDGRIIIMNKAYLDMVKTASKIILLAPFVKDIKFERTHLNIVKYYSNFSPVYNSVETSDESRWLDLLIRNEEQKLIYFRRPPDMYGYLKAFIGCTPEDGSYSTLYKEEIDYLEKNYSSEWVAIKLLKRGYGIHHWKIPMFLRKFYETQYNSKQLKGLFCTSTLMEGINTPTQSMIILGELKDNFELNNLMGRVGRLTGGKPLIGKIFICNEKTKDLFSNSLDGWLNLQILAERSKPTNNEERFMLHSSDDLGDESAQYKKDLKVICSAANKSEEEIKEYDVKYIKLKKFVEENYKDSFVQAKTLYDVIKIGYEFIGKNLNYYFSKIKIFPDVTTNSNKAFTASYYIMKLLLGSTIKECVDDFNENFNTSKNIDYINLFIDSLNEAVSYIKFELMKLPNYLRVFNIDISGNEILSKFCMLLGGFVDNDIAMKILDDLGIERSDSSRIVDVLNISGTISTSQVIKLIENNRDKLVADKALSPFSKHNIKNM